LKPRCRLQKLSFILAPSGQVEQKKDAPKKTTPSRPNHRGPLVIKRKVLPENDIGKRRELVLRSPEEAKLWVFSIIKGSTPSRSLHALNIPTKTRSDIDESCAVIVPTIHFESSANCTILHSVRRYSLRDVARSERKLSLPPFAHAIDPTV
jgi:hypothetical protein